MASRHPAALRRSEPPTSASVAAMLSRSDDLDLANLVDGNSNGGNDDDEDEDEEQEIELRRSKDNITARVDSTPSITCPSSSSSPSPSRVASPVRSGRVSESSRRRLDDREQQQQQQIRPSSPTAPLRERFNSVISATTHVVSHLDTVADSVAEAMSLLQHPFGGSSQSHLQQPLQSDRKKEREAYNIEPKLEEAREMQVRLKLQALWQLLLTGFEVLKFAVGKRARRRVLWLALDGKLYLTTVKNDRNPNKCIFLADIYKIQKGSAAPSFTKSQSWRDVRGSKEQLCFAVHGSSARREKTFALQVQTASVRNVVVENLLALLQRMKSDADGEFPCVAQRVIAQQYAATGDVIALHQVEDILLRDEDEKRNANVVATNAYTPPNRKTKSAGGSVNWTAATTAGSAGSTSTGARASTGKRDNDDDGDEDDDNDNDAQRHDILG